MKVKLFPDEMDFFILHIMQRQSDKRGNPLSDYCTSIDTMIGKDMDTTSFGTGIIPILFSFCIIIPTFPVIKRKFQRPYGF